MVHRSPIRLALVGSVAAFLCGTLGCKSAYVEAVVRNNTSSPVTLVEVDYPSASFGTGALAPGAEFHYRFKVLGSGTTKALWTDAGHHEHSMAGPTLEEGQQGHITITLNADTAVWDVHVQR